MANELIARRYRLRELLGSGPMSEVWAADDEDLERRVALKLLAPDADRARFDREARAAAALAHPHIVQLFDYGEAEGRPYMVLEHLPGGTLEDRLHGSAPLPDDETHRIASEIAAGLAHAHSRGLVHRDLKPANILFDAEGRAKIGDFGIARLGGSGTLTEAGTVLGTAAYISPEQAAGEAATPASDVYSFGVILYRLLTGRLPFDAPQPMELLQLHRNVPPPSLGVVRPDAPAALAALATDALAKDPAARPQDGAELLERLGTPAVAAPLAPAPAPATATATQVLQTPPRPSRRRRPPAAVLAAVVALLAAGGAALAYAVTRPTAPASDTFPTEVGHRTLPKLTTSTATHRATTLAPAPSTTAATTSQPPTTTEARTTTRAQTTAGTTTFTAPPTTAPPATTEATTTAPPPLTTAPTTTSFGTTTSAD